MNEIFFAILILVDLGFGAAAAHAQNNNNAQNNNGAKSPSAAKAEDLNKFSVKPGNNPFTVTMPSDAPPNSPNAARSAPSAAPLTELKMADSHQWNRFAGGFWLGLSDAEILRSLLHVSNDQVLMGHATETAFGLGAQLDFGLPNVTDESFRFRLGVFRSSVNANDDVKAAHAPNQLEDTLNIFNVSGIYRWAFDVLPDPAKFWLGAGGQVSYAFSSSLPAGGTQVSQLRNAYGINAIVAMGADIPVSTLNDLTAEFQYLPLKGYALYIGFRSTL